MHKKADYKGLIDTSKWSIGGIWFSGKINLKPFVWLFKWPPGITAQLCSDENP